MTEPSSPLPHPIPPPTQPVQLKPHTSHMKVVVGIVLVFFIIVIASAYWLTQQQMKNVVLPPVTPTTYTQGEIEDRLDGWETYQGDGFSFQYPMGWFVENSCLGGFENDTYVCLKSPDYQANEVPAVQNGQLIIFAPKGSSYNVGVQIATEFCETLSEMEKVTSCKEINISDMKALKKTHEFPPITRVGILENNNIGFEIRLEYPYNTSVSFETFDQIISTFEFTASDENNSQEITIDQDLQNPVSSPLVLTGRVEAGWMFEGQFIVKLLDENRNVIVQGVATETVPGSWMQDVPIQFETNLNFNTDAKKGYLVFENDNPSGLPENSKQLEYEVSFQ